MLTADPEQAEDRLCCEPARGPGGSAGAQAGSVEREPERAMEHPHQWAVADLLRLGREQDDSDRGRGLSL